MSSLREALSDEQKERFGVKPPGSLNLPLEEDCSGGTLTEALCYVRKLLFRDDYKPFVSLMTMTTRRGLDAEGQFWRGPGNWSEPCARLPRA